MLFELIAIGGWIFWSLVALAFLLEFVAVGYEKAWPSVLLPILFTVVMGLFSSFNPILYGKENWQMLLISLGIYVVAACVWAIFKWYRRCVRRGKIYANCLETWAEKNMPEGVNITSVNDIPMDKRIEFFKALKDAFYYGMEDEAYGREQWDIDISKVTRYQSDSGVEYARKEHEAIEVLQKEVLKKVLSSPKDNKERITVWMVAWPFSVLTTLVFDFLYDFFSWLRKSLSGLFIEISRMAFGKYRKDFENIKVEKEI